MRRIIITVAMLATGLLGAGQLLSSPAQAAYTGSDCNYTTVAGTAVTPSTTVNGTPVHVGVQAGPGGMHGDAPTEVGACLQVAPGTGVFEGGAVGVGVDPTAQNGRLCHNLPIPNSPGQQSSTTWPVGFYAIADGNNNNNPTAQLGGYAGVSNYESENVHGTPPTEGANATGCEGNNGSGTNSGGSVGVTALGVYAPVPFVACGNNDSGRDWSGSKRDGCFVDTTG